MTITMTVRRVDAMLYATLVGLVVLAWATDDNAYVMIPASIFSIAFSLWAVWWFRSKTLDQELDVK